MNFEDAIELCRKEWRNGAYKQYLQIYSLDQDCVVYKKENTEEDGRRCLATTKIIRNIILPYGTPRGYMPLGGHKGDDCFIGLRIEITRLIAHLIKGDEKIVEQRNIIPSPSGLSRRARTRVWGSRRSSFGSHGAFVLGWRSYSFLSRVGNRTCFFSGLVFEVGGGRLSERVRCLPAAGCNLYGGWKLADDGRSEGGELTSMEAHIMLAPSTCCTHLEAAMQNYKFISTKTFDPMNSSFLYKHTL